MKRRIVIWSGSALLILLGGAIWFALAHRGGSTFQVSTAQVTRGSIVRRIIVAGTLQPVQSVDVGSQVSGTIAALYVDYDSIVKKGQVLAKLDPALLQAALDNAQAAYEKAQADTAQFEVALEDARIKLTRAQDLAQRQLIPQSDLDAAVIAEKQAAADVNDGKAQVSRAKGVVEQAHTDLDHSVITAPVDGIVINRSVDVGQTVAASFQTPVLFHLAANIEHMQVQADVDEADVGVVKEGVPVTFIVEAYPNRTFAGTVSLVRPQPGSSTTLSGGGNAGSGGGSTTPGQGSATAGITYTTVINVLNPDRVLRPGMTATVFINGVQRGDAVRIPNQALLFRPSIDLLKAVGQDPVSMEQRETTLSPEEAQQVWKWDGKRFTPVDITLGISDAQWSEQATGPLKDGEELVINTTFKSGIKK